MNLCDNDHQEVCYEARHCPICTLREDLRREITELEEKVEKLEAQLEEEA